MFYCYILHNPTTNKYYIGSTSDLEQRVAEHNKSSHKTKYTRKQPGSWDLVYQERYSEITDAIVREKQIKSWKSKKAIIELIERSR